MAALHIVCSLWGETSCLGHDCIDRIGYPCIHKMDNASVETTPLPDGVDDYFETHDCDDYRDFEDQCAWEDAWADAHEEW